MPADELPEYACRLEEQVRTLQSAYCAEQEQRRLLEQRVAQIETILRRYGLSVAEDGAGADDGADELPPGRAWLMKRAYPHKRELLARLAARIAPHWDGERYAFRVHGHERVEVFALLGEMGHCINAPQTAFIGFIISYTDLGTNRNTIKSNLRYAATRRND